VTTCAGDMTHTDNKINGFWSCENNGTLAVDLKQRLNFTGWVMRSVRSGALAVALVRIRSTTRERYTAY
jgi:hypothetical protein